MVVSTSFSIQAQDFIGINRNFTSWSSNSFPCFKQGVSKLVLTGSVCRHGVHPGTLTLEYRTEIRQQFTFRLQGNIRVVQDASSRQ